MTVPAYLTSDQVRVAALRAGGLTGPCNRAVTRADLARVVARLGVIQIDSVNVAARAHLLPFYSRLGPYDLALLDRALSRRPAVAVEYWAHEASLVHPPLLSALKWRMDRARHEAWGGMADVGRKRPDLVEAIVETLAARPVRTPSMTARDLQAVLEPGGPRPGGNWGWNWSDVKQGVEWLFWSGRVTSAGRTAQFERLYTVPERFWPPEVVAAPVPVEADALDALVAHSAAALGVGTTADLRDYFRLPAAPAAAAVARLAGSGVLVPVTVEGWADAAWCHAEARVPSRRAARTAQGDGPTTLLSPFDPLVWFRPRTERIFDFAYRLEIYVPRERRRHGYYVLPFLLRGRPGARVDLRADRARGVLEVPAAWIETGAPADTPARLAAELTRFAAWLGLSRVGTPARGDLAADLAAAQRGTLPE